MRDVVEGRADRPVPVVDKDEKEEKEGPWSVRKETSRRLG